MPLDKPVLLAREESAVKLADLDLLALMDLLDCLESVDQLDHPVSVAEQARPESVVRLEKLVHQASVENLDNQDHPVSLDLPEKQVCLCYNQLLFNLIRNVIYLG